MDTMHDGLQRWSKLMTVFSVYEREKRFDHYCSIVFALNKSNNQMLSRKMSQHSIESTIIVQYGIGIQWIRNSNGNPQEFGPSGDFQKK